MSDEPSLTRWSFQDFKLVYDAKFGRKREVQPTKDKPAVENCNGSVANGDVRVQNTSDLAIYEQYWNQGAVGYVARGRLLGWRSRPQDVSGRRIGRERRKAAQKWSTPFTDSQLYLKRW